MKKIYTLLGSVLVMCLLPIQTMAATTILPASIELVGDAVELSFSDTTDPGFVYDSVFLPGNSVQRTLTIKNEKNVPFRVSYELERSSDLEEIDLLNQIDIQIYDGETLICEGIIDENPCDEIQVYGIFQPGDTREITMVATFNSSAGNEYKNKFAQYDWIFYAVVTGIPTTGTPTEPTTPVKKPVITTTGIPTTGLYALEIAVAGGAVAFIGRMLLKRKKDKSE